MRTALKGNYSATLSGFAVILFAYSLAQASPITQNTQTQGTTAAATSLAPTAVQRGKTRNPVVRIKPADLITSAPVKSAKAHKTSPKPTPENSSNLRSNSQEIPEIPWETIEHALKRQNLPSSAMREPRVVVGGDYQQLITNALPDFGLEVVNLQGPQDIPILDFLKTQSATLSTEIAIYTSDLAQPEHNIAMASNGNLDTGEEIAGSDVLGSSEDRPFKLKTLFFWGLGLLVLYTLLDAIFAKLRRQDPAQPRDVEQESRSKVRRPRRRRSFGRSRARHKHS